MISMTKRLKEQSLVAQTIVKVVFKYFSYQLFHMLKVEILAWLNSSIQLCSCLDQRVKNLTAAAMSKASIYLANQNFNWLFDMLLLSNFLLNVVDISFFLLSFYIKKYLPKHFLYYYRKIQIEWRKLIEKLMKIYQNWM